MDSGPTEQLQTPLVDAIPLASSSNGRVSGKPWKTLKSATVFVQFYTMFIVQTNVSDPTSSRSHIPEGVKTKNWEDRMEKTKKAQAIKMLQTELKEEKQAEITRYASVHFPLKV